MGRSTDVVSIANLDLSNKGVLTGPPFDGPPEPHCASPGNLKMPKHLPAFHFEIGCRIPKEYFGVIGWGESDVGIETGSYASALHMTGIEDYNVLLYTSVLPPEAAELPHLPDIHHGSVLEGIIAVQYTDRPGTRTMACSWQRSIAIETTHFWSALRANMPATDLSKKQMPIYGKRCGSYLRGAIKQGITDWSLGNR